MISARSPISIFPSASPPRGIGKRLLNIFRRSGWERFHNLIGHWVLHTVGHDGSPLLEVIGAHSVKQVSGARAAIETDTY